MRLGLKELFVAIAVLVFAGPAARAAQSRVFSLSAADDILDSVVGRVAPDDPATSASCILSFSHEEIPGMPARLTAFIRYQIHGQRYGANIVNMTTTPGSFEDDRQTFREEIARVQPKYAGRYCPGTPRRNRFDAARESAGQDGGNSGGSSEVSD